VAVPLAVRDAPKPPPAPAEQGLNPAKVWGDGSIGLPGGWTIAGASNTGTPKQLRIALDRQEDRYLKPRNPDDEVYNAPNGDFAVLVNPDFDGRIGLWNVHSGEVRMVPTDPPVADPQWSADGTSVVFKQDGRDGVSPGFAVLDVASATLRRHPIDTRYSCILSCFVTWMPNGKELSIPVEGGSDGRMQLFDAVTGAPTRTLPVAADLNGPWSWSPDGKLMLVITEGGSTVVDAATGAIGAELPGRPSYFVGNDRILGLQDDAAVLRDLTGKELERVTLPADLAASDATAAPR
jgi:hypothetical protein